MICQNLGHPNLFKLIKKFFCLIQWWRRSSLLWWSHMYKKLQPIYESEKRKMSWKWMLLWKWSWWLVDPMLTTVPGDSNEQPMSLHYYVPTQPFQSGFWSPYFTAGYRAELSSVLSPHCCRGCQKLRIPFFAKLCWNPTIFNIIYWGP